MHSNKIRLDHYQHQAGLHLDVITEIILLLDSKFHELKS
jgi:hypothetical protein